MLLLIYLKALRIFSSTCPPYDLTSPIQQNSDCTSCYDSTYLAEPGFCLPECPYGYTPNYHNTCEL